MSSRRPPRMAAWLLKHFGCGTDTDPMLGDLAERYTKGKTPIWYWKQVVISILISRRDGVFNYRVSGLWIGALVATSSIAGNIARNDRHGTSAFPSLIDLLMSPLVIFAIARYWSRRGATSTTIRSNVRHVARSASLLFGISHFLFVCWWFSINPLIVFSPRGIGHAAIPALSGYCLYWLMKVSGYVAVRLPMRGSISA